MRTKGCLQIIGLLCIILKLSECTLYRDGEIQLEYVGERLTFDAAEKRCKSQNRQLVELRNEEEWNEVRIVNSISY